MGRMFEGARLDVPALAASMAAGADLSINTVRKSDLKRLKGLDTLPLASLALRWLSAPDLTQIPLPSSLTSLRIWHSPKFVSLSSIDAAPDLAEVSLRGNGPLQNPMPLRDLPKLSRLSIEGDTMSLQEVPTLAFLEDLPITCLSLRAIAGNALDLGPIARLPDLEELDLHGPNFPASELAKVAAAKPWFLSQLLDLPDCTISGQGCTTCKGLRKVLFLESAKGLWCPICEAKGLGRKLDEFQEMVAKAGM